VRAQLDKAQTYLHATGLHAGKLHFSGAEVAGPQLPERDVVGGEVFLTL